MKRKMSEEYDYYVRIVIDGMDVNSVKTILNAFDFFIENYHMTIGVDFLNKTLQLFDPHQNKEIKIKASLLVLGKEERFSSLMQMYYHGALVVFFIKENNVRTPEIVYRNTIAPVIKILDTPKEFTYELFESIMKELVESFE